MNKSKVLLVGYIGKKNFGDDLLFKIALDTLKDIGDFKIFVLVSSDPDSANYLMSYHPDINLLYHKRTPLLFFNKFDKIYFIGGGLFFDYKKSVNLLRFCKNFISNFIRYRIPKMFGTSFGGIGLGIGPYYSKRTKILHSQIIGTFDILGVRDEVSFDLAKSMGINKMFLSNDLSLNLLHSFQEIGHVADKSNEVIFCPRSYSHNPVSEKHLDELLKFADFLNNQGLQVHWVFLQDDDERFIQRLEEQFQVTVWNPDTMDILDFSKLFKNVRMLVSSRMHSVFIAGMLCTPFISIPLHQKLYFASKLFYEKPVFVNPTAGLQEYIIAYESLTGRDMSLDKINKEVLILDNLVNDLKVWLLH